MKKCRVHSIYLLLLHTQIHLLSMAQASAKQNMCCSYFVIRCKTMKQCISVKDASHERDKTFSDSTGVQENKLMSISDQLSTLRKPAEWSYLGAQSRGIGSLSRRQSRDGGPQSREDGQSRPKSLELARSPPLDERQSPPARENVSRPRSSRSKP